jgi:cbb3-type cytochrome c oxidase subunit III
MGSYHHYKAEEMASLIRYLLNKRDKKSLEIPDLPKKRSVVAGQIVYAHSCAPCHGNAGQGGMAANLINPAFLNAASDDFIAAAILHGRCTDSSQNAKPDTFLDQELADVIEYLRKTASRGRQTPPGRIVEGNAKEGEQLYEQSCIGCHGKNGRNGTAPELANETFQNIVMDGYIQATIVRGRSSAGMPGFAMNNMNYKKLTIEEVNSLVQYIRTLKNTNDKKE